MESQEKKQEQTKEKIKQSSNDLWSGVVDFFDYWIDLKDDLDKEGTIINIQNNKRMRGANAWLLMCSIMVASLGLNLNSPAVIIGAMLISPLMSPILGIGLSIGINDRSALWIAIKHFSMSVAIALFTGIIYFSLTPLDEFTSEIAARTEPTFLDVLVAIFGGLAGIISGSRMDKSNAIPGVAIATALMPPLCVTGYGLANGEWTIAFNSFYLFFMNSTFIALTTYLLVTFMDFPKKKYETSKERARTRRILVAVAILMLTPSIWIFWQVVENVRERNRITEFVENKFPDAIYEINRTAKRDSFEVKIYLFENLSDSILSEYHRQLENLECSADFTIIDQPENGISKNQFEQTTKNIQNEYLERMEEQKSVLLSETDRRTAFLQGKLDSLQSDTVIFKAGARELKALFPLLSEVRYAKMQSSNDEKLLLPTVMVSWGNRKSRKSRNRDNKRIYDFMRLRQAVDTLQVIEF